MSNYFKAHVSLLCEKIPSISCVFNSISIAISMLYRDLEMFERLKVP
jgi:hypothetical protein